MRIALVDAYLLVALPLPARSYPCEFSGHSRYGAAILTILRVCGCDGLVVENYEDLSRGGKILVHP